MRFSVLCLLALAVATCYAQQPNHASWGFISPQDSIVYSHYHERSSTILTVTDEVITYPPTGVLNFNNITAIHAWDHHTNGNGANATIIAGGISNTTVTVRLRSQRGSGIRFSVEIFTVPCQPPLPWIPLDDL